MLQAGAESLLEDGRGETTVGSVKAELGRAERFFRDALMSDPHHLEARVRYGNTVGRLGRHRDAIAALRRAIADGVEGDLLYLAHLFLGREEEAVRNVDGARDAYERAARARPNAQTPRLAMSFLAQRIGDRGAAQRELDALARLPVAEDRRDDPWWKYFSLR
jgi:tetratricopeptide (TPR) repeat protein